MVCFTGHPDHSRSVHASDCVSVPLMCLTAAILMTFAFLASQSLPDGALPPEVEALCKEITTMTGIPPHPNIVNALGYTIIGKSLSLLQPLVVYMVSLNLL